MNLPKLGLTRNVIKPGSYALLTPDGHVASVLPGWTACTPIVQISAALGAAFSQILLLMGPEGRGSGSTEDETWFFYVVTGKVKINGQALPSGGFACLPPASAYDVRGAAKNTRLLLFRKPYEWLADHSPVAFFSGHVDDVPATPFLGDPHARLQTLIPDTLAADMAVNVFTYDPGATLPFVETHVMEHGMLFLSGGGIYRLDQDWHPVTEGDALWIAPYCPQWFIASGPHPARYIYYKDINRLP